MILYDKLKNIKTEEEKFTFICPNCKANGMKKGVFNIKPLGVSWKPNIVDNSDLPDNIRRFYNSLPTMKEAIVIACNKNSETSNIVIHCNKCNTSVPVYEKIDLPLIRKWLNKNISYVLDLRINKFEDENAVRKRKSCLRH